MTMTLSYVVKLLGVQGEFEKEKEEKGKREESDNAAIHPRN